MQMRALVVLAALVLPTSAAVSSLSAARLWLRAHSAGAGPSGDELAELKGTNPQAYAIVKALLAKRSLGLLDPLHPTAKFAKPAGQQEPAVEGPEAFAKLATPEELHHQALATVSAVTVPYADVSAPAHHDWMNWKPQNSATDDESMVQNVLGAVAELKSKKAGFLSQHRNTEENTIVAEADKMEEYATVEPQIAKPEPAKPAPVEAAPAPKKANGYLDFNMMTQERPKSASLAVKENSYLAGLNLMGDDAKGKSAESSSSGDHNYLQTFSWNDDAKPVVKEQPKPSLAQVNPKEASLLNWLGVANKAPEPKKVQAAPSNPYISDLLG